MIEGWRSPGPERAFLAFAAAVGAFQNLPAVLPEGAFIDLATPFAVVGAAALVLLSLGARGAPLVLGVAAAVMYTSGQGIHLAANSIADELPTTRVLEVSHFWDETFGHLWWHGGWLGLIVAFCLAERASPRRSAGPFLDDRLLASSLLLGFTLFTNTVEGGTWWLALAAGVAVWVWAARERRPLLLACALAFALNALLIGIWAAWHGGLPQFSELGLV